MKGSIIYYRQGKDEVQEETVQQIKMHIKNLSEESFEVFGVYIDEPESADQLLEMINNSFDQIRYLFIAGETDSINQFDYELIKQISQRELIELFELK